MDFPNSFPRTFPTIEQTTPFCTSKSTKADHDRGSHEFSSRSGFFRKRKTPKITPLQSFNTYVNRELLAVFLNCYPPHYCIFINVMQSACVRFGDGFSTNRRYPLLWLLYGFFRMPSFGVEVVNAGFPFSDAKAKASRGL